MRMTFWMTSFRSIYIHIDIHCWRILQQSYIEIQCGWPNITCLPSTTWIFIATSTSWHYIIGAFGFDLYCWSRKHESGLPEVWIMLANTIPPQPTKNQYHSSFILFRAGLKSSYGEGNTGLTIQEPDLGRVYDVASFGMCLYNAPFLSFPARSNTKFPFQAIWCTPSMVQLHQWFRFAVSPSIHAPNKLSTIGATLRIRTPLPFALTGPPCMWVRSAPTKLPSLHWSRLNTTTSHTLTVHYVIPASQHRWTITTIHDLFMYKKEIAFMYYEYS